MDELPGDIPKETEQPDSAAPDEVSNESAEPSSEPTFQVNEEAGLLLKGDGDGLLKQMAGMFLLWWNWAYFEMRVVKPNLSAHLSPRIIMPEIIAGTQEFEFVYPIHDFGDKLSTSKATDMFSVGMSMCKLYYTIEKMIFILIERLKEGGVDGKTEVQVMFDGHLLAQRKAFESIINLSQNVVVANFDPSAWGERYLNMVKRLADKGFGYPAEAPRTLYKLSKSQAGAKMNKGQT